ncbi:MAG: SDR family NAD(P)-dependent oxidoreductase [Steroidobacteraceae bacterium]|nr:SDR family NAD(P)-dependent oxidoreductase [Steroidobacteraceae bacterium]
MKRREVVAGLAGAASIAGIAAGAGPPAAGAVGGSPGGSAGPGAGAGDAAGLPAAPPAPGRPPKRFDARGCVALVTGANRGVGLGFVEVLLARGAKRVYATGRNPRNLPQVVALDPQRVVPLTLDVTDEAQRRAAAAAAPDVTLLINNAAYPGSEVAAERRMLSAASLDDARRVMDTNCWSPAELARLFVPLIVRNGGGAVVNILSVGAYFCLPEFSSYSISKAAAAIMTAGLRAETDRQPVLVSQVVTGSVLTRASPVGTRNGVTPVQHAEEVLDALAQGETEILAAGSRGFFERLRADPKAFERGVIDRFFSNPVRIAPYG